MTTRTLKCFVAMAFGNDDTDAIYDRAICPVLKQEHVKPIRIDRKEHNRNINDVIVDEIRGSQFLIADLTYARPSVYFEAGFGEFEKPVIYTVRADHLKPSAKAATDNLRVHFDVSMRNIVKWQTPDDPQFAERLGHRVRHVLKPILLKHRGNEEQRAKETLFASLPLMDQTSELEAHFESFFTKRRVSTDDGRSPFRSVFRTLNNRTAVSIADKAQNTWHAKSGFFTIRTVADALAMVPTSHSAKFDRIERHLVLMSLQSVPFSRLRDAFWNATADTTKKCVRFTTREVSGGAPKDSLGRLRAQVAESTYVYIVDKLKSPEDLCNRLEKLFPNKLQLSET